MEKFKIIFFTVAPFIIFSIFHYISSPLWMNDRIMMEITVSISLVFLLLILGAQVIVKDKHYFPSTVTLFFTVWALMIFLIPDNNYSEYLQENSLISFLLAHPQFGLYSSLFLMASVIPILGLDPFTYYFAKKGVPEPFQSSKLYKAVNLYITYFWAILFGLSMSASFLSNIWLQSLVPALLQLIIGMPATHFLIPYLQKKLAHLEHGVHRDYLTNAYDAVKGMPFIYNRKSSKDIYAIFQFHIHGEENFDAYILIENSSCTFFDGLHDSPHLKITSPSDIWLKISRGDLDGPTAFLTRMYSVDGDLSYLMKLQELFDGTEKANIPSMSEDKNKYSNIKREYRSLEAGTVKKVLAIQGSPRGKGVSKTDIVTEEFLKGCRESGAETETIYLKDKKINHCTGCFTCWTKTPGTCIFKDNVKEIMDKELEADLIVYAFPLYHFGIYSVMKKYIERTLPMLEPYLIAGSHGETYHPMRDEYKKKRFGVIISVCGFPEVSHFSAVSENIHALAGNNTEDGLAIVAEIYRPASETINLPFYEKERKRVFQQIQNAGRQVVLEGKINIETIKAIGRVEIYKEQMHKEANMTWDLCINEGKTLPQIQSEFINGKNNTA